ncbi:tetratricopeptide repeat protein [bacterium]|nr:tetratricopeptide repeat protein [bacterium]
MRKSTIAVFLVSLLGLCFSDTLSIAPDSNRAVETVVETVYVRNDTTCAYGKDEIIAFADHLFGLGEYDRASIEYLRYSFIYSDNPCVDAVLFKAGLCKEHAGDYRAARKIYSTLLSVPDERANSFAGYRIPLTYLLENKPDSALSAIVPTVQTQGAIQYLKGWIYLHQKRYSDALSLFENISDNAESSDVAGSIDYLLHRSRQGEKLSRRSPFLAGLLSSVVPGLGRAYCGRWDDGLFSFIIVGSTGSLSYAEWNNDKEFASVMAVISAFFYLGNIYGSAKGAEVYNIEKDKIFWKTTWKEVPHPPTMLYSDFKCEKTE